MSTVGIDAIGIYVPGFTLPLDLLAAARGVPPEKIRVGLGAYEMAVAPPWEDTVTLGANAVQRLLADGALRAEEVGLLLVATETAVDHAKPVGIFLHELLGLPAMASLQQVINAQEAERQRRARLAAREKDKNLAWWNHPVPPKDELWLFVDTVTGLPVKPEMHNERWHRVRAWVDEHDPDNAWPRTIVYRNLRHHAATKWFHEELGESWEVVAQYLGDKLTTVLNHYVRAGEDALRDSVSKLAKR